MPGSSSKLFWAEATLAGAAGFLAVLTLITREWIELVFGVDPDHGNGWVEWSTVIGAAAAAGLLTLLARHERRRLRPAVEAA
jgi:hypothetical protein